MLNTIKLPTLFFVILLAIVGCKEERNPVPSVPVYEEFFLNTIEAQNLNNDGGYMVTERGGVKGLIIYRNTAADFRAFDRTCPTSPNDSCARVNIDASTLFIACPCCQSQFNFDGNVMAGSAPAGLRRYNIARQGSLLTVTN